MLGSQGGGQKTSTKKKDGINRKWGERILGRGKNNLMPL